MNVGYNMDHGDNFNTRKVLNIMANKTTFSSLPDEIKLKVFSFLSAQDKLLTASLVCKKWHHLCQDWSLWRHLELRGWKLTIPKAIQLVKNLPHVSRLTLNCWFPHQNESILATQNVDDVLQAASTSCTSLEKLHLACANIAQEETLEDLVQNCPGLTEVTVEYCRLPGNGSHLLDTFLRCQNLRCLQFNFNSPLMLQFDERTMHRRCPKLTEVAVTSTTTDAEVGAVVACVGPQLKALHTFYLHNPESYLLLTRCQNLRDLCLTDAVSMTNEGLLKGVGSLHHLHRLVILMATSLTADALITFFSRRRVVGHLRHLDMGGTRQLNDECVDALVDKACLCLTYLDIGSCKVTKWCTFLNLATRCRQLTDLYAQELLGLRLEDFDLQQLSQVRPGLVIHDEGNEE